MDSNTYNAIAMPLLVGVVLALAVALFSLVAAIVRWKTPKRSGHIIRGVIAVISIPCLVGIQQFMLWGVFLPELGRQQRQENQARHAESSLVDVGDPAPEFTVETIDGQPFSLEQARGKVVLINFFATWCGPCLKELPHVERLWKAYQDKPGFHLLVIGREETVDTIKSFRDEHGFTFPLAADPDRAIYSQFAKESIPRTLLISRDGAITMSLVGFHEDDFNALKAALDQELAHSPRQ